MTDDNTPVSTSKVKGLLSKKVAGIPVIAIVLVAAAALLYMSIRMRSTPDTTALPDDETTDGDVAGDIAPGDQPVFSARTPTPVSVTGTTVTGVANADTNDLWADRVSNWMRTQGYSYDQVRGMLSRFLAGESLTTEQDKLRNIAIGQFGEPPEEVDYAPIDNGDSGEDSGDTDEPNVPDTPGTPGTPGTTPEPPTTNPPYSGPASPQGKPPLTHTVRGTSDNSAAELAALYYPTHPGGTGITQIRQANPGLDFSTVQAVGTKVHIPELVDPKYFTATSAVHTSGAIAAKNGTTAKRIQELNPNMNFPVAAGTRVRVA